MRHKPDSRVPISPWIMGGMLAVCGVVAYLLIPNNKTILDRLLRDGYSDRARTVLRSITPRERAKDPAFFTLAELRLQRQLLTTNSPASLILAQLQGAVEAAEQFQFRDPFRLEIIERLRQIHDPGAAFQVLRPSLNKTPQAIRQEFLKILVASALAQNSPGVAAEIGEAFWKQSPPTPDNTLELVKRWRAAAKPDRALAAIDFFSKQGSGKLLSIAPALARERISLLRELGRPGDAFDAIRELMPTLDKSGQAEWRPILITAAQQSNRVREVLDEIKQNATSSPQNPAAWKEYGELALAAGETAQAAGAFRKLAELEPGNPANLFRLGQVLEWSGQPTNAFDAYLKALPGRNPMALERLLSLNAGLYRDEELAQNVKAYPDLIGRENLLLPVARLQAKVGDFDQARKFYRLYLEKSPSETDTWIEYVRLLNELFEYEDAFSAVTRALQFHPQDFTLQKLYGVALTQQGRYEDAQRYFKKLTENHPDDFVIRNYIFLSESLGQMNDLISGLQAKIKSDHEVTEGDYLRLANIQLQTGRTNESQRSLLAGLEKFPNDGNLRIQAAYSLAGQGHYREAARLVELHPDLRKDESIVRYYSSLLVASQDYPRLARFFESGIDPAVLDTPGLWEIRAALLEANKQLPAAHEFYAKLYHHDPNNLFFVMNYARSLAGIGRAKEAETVIAPYLTNPTPPILTLAAQVYSTAGNQSLAAKYQQLYIATNPSDIVTAWGLLGDILLTRGDKVNARRAYRHGLDAMLTSLATRRATP